MYQGSVMESIIENFVAYIKTQDLYTIISSGVLFTLVFAIIIYKSTQKPHTRYIEEISDDDIYADDLSTNDPIEHEKSSQSETSAGTWLIIDSVAILTFTIISYVLFFKKIWMGQDVLRILMKSVGVNIMFYYCLIKPTLFNTNQK